MIAGEDGAIGVREMPQPRQRSVRQDARALRGAETPKLMTEGITDQTDSRS